MNFFGTNIVVLHDIFLHKIDNHLPVRSLVHRPYWTLLLFCPVRSCASFSRVVSSRDLPLFRLFGTKQGLDTESGQLAKQGAVFFRVGLWLLPDLPALADPV